MADVKWISDQSGNEYRLPTEAEWEYAVRLGTDTVYYWGDDPKQPQGCDYANVADQSVKEQLGWTSVFDCRDGYVYTARFGRFRANGFGVHDMLGNVREWTCSAYDKNYGGAEHACISKDRADLRVLRGGSWLNRAALPAFGLSPLVQAGHPDQLRLRRFSPRQNSLTLCSLCFYPLRGSRGHSPLVASRDTYGEMNTLPLSKGRTGRGSREASSVYPL